ncbi:nitrilase-related carbon-nitrogen hydrolase [Pasteuria penetrans]|uniref:nitrilase-related carbon-nitrogen hydrolase n=1 Tax=Pasteuria penetrans TaxID=86005 RepID=UPI000FAE6936|nr:nitrilase-related carbon-nitrogen hydrolase [Pasteuria penetrans]
MRVGLAQIRPRLGSIKDNLELHRTFVKNAKSAKVDLLIFPELSLTGYHLLDLTYEVARSLHSPDIQSLVRMSKDIGIVFGFVEESSQHILYNTVVYAAEGRIQRWYRKVHLSTYGMFDEARYLGAGCTIRSFADVTGTVVGFMVGEDAWHVMTGYLLAQTGATVFIVPANVPICGMDESGATLQGNWLRLLQVLSQVHGVYCLYANRIGTEDGVTFAGNSMVIDPRGHVRGELPLLEEGLLVEMLDKEIIRQARLKMPLLRGSRADLVLRELHWIVRQSYREGD